MRLSNAILRALGVFVAVSILEAVAGGLAAMVIPPKALPPNLSQHLVEWLLATNAVTVAALSPLAMRSDWRGWRLGAAIAVIPAAIAFINGIEGVVFLPNSAIDWPRIFLITGLTALFSVPVWALLFGRRSPEQTDARDQLHPIASKSRGERAWKFAVCDIAYFVLYLTAGTIIWPYVKDFYATQKLPSLPTLLALELMVRAPAFIVLCLLLVRMLGLPRLQGALAVGALFAVLSGVVPLMMPNPYFPDVVRFAHLCETTGSNFVFAAIVAWLWGRPRLTAPLALQHAA